MAPDLGLRPLTVTASLIGLELVVRLTFAFLLFYLTPPAASAVLTKFKVRVTSREEVASDVIRSLDCALSPFSLAGPYAGDGYGARK